jgi:putative DNA-invertase from lambdoid prophage Rac
VTDRLYLRHSTDKQTNLRQKHHLADYLTAGSPVYEDPATSSRLHPLKRPAFLLLLDEAAVSDVVRLADAARLFRSVRDVLDVRDVLRRRGLHLRIASGAWAGMDLTSDDPMTKLFVTMLAGVLEFQRDMISENTKDGVAAARTGGKTLGRPTRLTAQQTADIVSAHGQGTAVKALARQYGVDPKVIRRALDAAGARELPGDLVALAAGDDQDDAADGQDQAAAPDTEVTADVPGLLADYLSATGDEDTRRTLGSGRIIRRGQGYTLRLTAPASVHRTLLDRCAPLSGADATPADRKAHRIYSDRLHTTQESV